MASNCLSLPSFRTKVDSPCGSRSRAHSFASQAAAQYECVLSVYGGASMLKVLDGVRLLEVAEWFFVPGAGTVLADWGADVIKIEHPTRGDPLRGLISSGIIPGAHGLNFFIENGSRNKRSLGLDLGSERGREILYKLVEKSDVFLT